jgi:hypothetical protein
MKLSLTLVKLILTEWHYYNAECDREKYRLENTALAGDHCDLSDVVITVSSSRETEENYEQVIIGSLVNNKPSISKHSVANYC